MRRILFAICLAHAMVAGDAHIAGMGPFDKRLLTACATDPHATSYKLLHNLFSADVDAKPLASQMNPDGIDAAIRARMYGIAQFLIGGLLSRREATNGQVRGWSYEIVARMDRQSTYLGRAKPAMTWITMEDDRLYTPEDLLRVGPFMDHPLVAATFFKDVRQDVLSQLLRSPAYENAPALARVMLLEAAVNAKAVDYKAAEVQDLLPRLAAASLYGAVLRYRLATTRDAALAADFAKSLEAADKAKDWFVMMQLETSGMDLVPLLDLQNLRVDDKAKARLLRAAAGHKVQVQDEDEEK